MKRAKFTVVTRLCAAVLLALVVTCLWAPRLAAAETYTTMDSSGNLVTSDSLQSAIATARATGRPIAIDPGHSDGTAGRDPGAIGPNGLREGDVAWNTAMRAKYYLEKWGIQVVIVRGEHEDPSLRERVQRAVDANCCAIVSMHYNSAGPYAVGSMVLVPRRAQYNSDLYAAGQALAKAINGELNKRAGITTRWDSAPTKGNGSESPYDTGEESDYFGIIRYARKQGILGVIIEHEFISNPAMEAKLSDPSFIDYIGWADAWGIWDHFYASDTWWSMSRVDVSTDARGQIVMSPHLIGVGTGMTYSYYYKPAGGSWVTLAENTTKTSSTFMPPSKGTYTLYITARSSDGSSVSRQINYDSSSISPSPGWHKYDAGWMYFDSNGVACKNTWVKDADGWHLFNSEGIAVSGWAKPNDRWFYLDPTLPHNAAKFGQVTDGDKTYLIDENSGMACQEWVQNSEGTWSWATDSGALASGWATTKWGRVFYFDPHNPLHPADLGMIMVNGYPYWIDEQLGLATSQWVTLPSGRRVWADGNGYLRTSSDAGAKLITEDDASPSPGWHKYDAGWMYFDSNGVACKNTWVKDADGWHLFNSEGIAVSGWAKPNDRWFYLDPTLPHNAAKFGQVTDGDKTYLIDENSGMACQEWVQNSEGTWSWATDSGALASGWATTKWGRVFYFDPHNPLHPADLGMIMVNGYPYWIDEQLGLATSQWVTLPSGRRVWADGNGYLRTSSDAGAKLITEDDASDPKPGDDDDNNQEDPSNKPARGAWSTNVSILGSATLTKADLVADLKAGLAVRGISYPEALAAKGAATPEAFIDQLWDAALAEGVRPEVLYAQAMLETGYLKFGGDVKVEQCNFGGLGATGNGVSGDTYDSVSEGLLAQSQHLRVYTGNYPLTAIVDKRFGNWLLNRQKANPATTIGKLAGTWAMDSSYGDRLVSILNRL
ncbi:N-acetylmuramoyl-L-alanine amidase [Lancefieldella sp. Marseille-Q7238]|uniref:N-acetylmuramoyl-L-alanine amidase n=1 Tax=Lancefieldella sp. Marseille-Q7238 TaxID=3022127 RepID=UPI0024A94C62|nr:N-acetylmuramoyl-L-alanine amidase [Lancefieldella sp. Marseille-Q7238]